MPLWESSARTETTRLHDTNGQVLYKKSSQPSILGGN